MSIPGHLARRPGYNLPQAPLLLLLAALLLIATCVAERGEVDGRFAESGSPANKKDRFSTDALLDAPSAAASDVKSPPSESDILANLRRRFPEIDPDVVAKVLKDNDGHGGRSATALRKLLAEQARAAEAAAAAPPEEASGAAAVKPSDAGSADDAVVSDAGSSAAPSDAKSSPEKDAGSSGAPSDAKSPPEKNAGASGAASDDKSKPDEDAGSSGGGNEAAKAHQASGLNWQHFSDGNTNESEASGAAEVQPSHGATKPAQSSSSSSKDTEPQESIGKFIADAGGGDNSSANHGNAPPAAAAADDAPPVAGTDGAADAGSSGGGHEAAAAEGNPSDGASQPGDDSQPKSSELPADHAGGDDSQPHDTSSGDQVKPEDGDGAVPPQPSTSEPAQPDNGSGGPSGDSGSKVSSAVPTPASGKGDSDEPERQPEAQQPAPVPPQDSQGSPPSDNGGSQGPWVVNLAQGPVPTAVLSQGKNNMQIVDVEQLQKSQENLDKVMADTVQEIAKSLTSLYESTSKHVQGEAYKMFDVVKLMHSDGEERVRLLLERERRLQVTMMHGQYGKCCCTPGSEPDCSWSIAPKLLGDFSRKCEMTKNAYTEFLGEPKAGALEDKMLDQCSQAPDWLQFTSNQIVNDCDKYSEKLSRDMNTLGSSYGTFFH